jgi:hypothetical protein
LPARYSQTPQARACCSSSLTLSNASISALNSIDFSPLTSSHSRQASRATHAQCITFVSLGFFCFAPSRHGACRMLGDVCRPSQAPNTQANHRYMRKVTHSTQLLVWVRFTAKLAPAVPSWRAQAVKPTETHSPGPGDRHPLGRKSRTPAHEGPAPSASPASHPTNHLPHSIQVALKCTLFHPPTMGAALIGSHNVHQCSIQFATTRLRTCNHITIIIYYTSYTSMGGRAANISMYMSNVVLWRRCIQCYCTITTMVIHLRSFVRSYARCFAIHHLSIMPTVIQHRL